MKAVRGGRCGYHQPEKMARRAERRAERKERETKRRETKRGEWRERASVLQQLAEVSQVGEPVEDVMRRLVRQAGLAQQLHDAWAAACALRHEGSTWDDDADLARAAYEAGLGPDYEVSGADGVQR